MIFSRARARVTPPLHLAKVFRPSNRVIALVFLSENPVRQQLSRCFAKIGLNSIEGWASSCRFFVQKSPARLKHPPSRRPCWLHVTTLSPVAILVKVGGASPACALLWHHSELHFVMC